MARTSPAAAGDLGENSLFCQEIADEDRKYIVKERLINMNSFREIFLKKVKEYYDQGNEGLEKPWTRNKIASVIAKLKKGTIKSKRLVYYYMYMNGFDNSGTQEFLSYKMKNKQGLPLRIIAREDYFYILVEIHILHQHVGQDKMLSVMDERKIYITKKALEIFLAACPVCNSKRKRISKKMDFVPRSIKICQLNEKGQFELINCESSPDGIYTCLLIYQNIASKFTILRPLISMNPKDIAYELLNIFLTLGAPLTLLSDLKQDFVTRILEEVAGLWAGCNIQHDTQKIEKLEDEIQDQLYSWMSDNNSLRWSVGCLYLQYHKNSSIDPAAGKIPYEVLFGRIPTVKTKTSSDSVATSSM